MHTPIPAFTRRVLLAALLAVAPFVPPSAIAQDLKPDETGRCANEGEVTG